MQRVLLLLLCIFLVENSVFCQDISKSGEVLALRKYQPNSTSIYNKCFWSDLSDFSITGATPIISNTGGILMSGGRSTWGNYIALNNTVNADENIEIEVTYIALSVSAFGLYVGKKPTNANFPTGYCAGYDLKNNISTIVQTNHNSSLSSVNSGFTVNVNDLCKLKYTQNAATITATFTNLTQQLTAEASYNNTQHLGGNVGQLAIFNYSDSVEIKQISAWTNINQRPVVLCIGDVKTNNPTAYNRYPVYLSELYTVNVYSAQSSTTQDILNAIPYLISVCKPAYVILNIGRDDIVFGVSEATTELNYRSIVALLTNEGISIINLLPIPEPFFDQTTLYNFIVNAYTNHVDPSVGWNSSIYLASDNQTPNMDGARFIASRIIASGKITY